MTRNLTAYNLSKLNQKFTQLFIDSMSEKVIIVMTTMNLINYGMQYLMKIIKLFLLVIINLKQML